MGGAIGERHEDEQRLHFEELGAQIRTRVTRISEHGLTVEQALPFLRLNGRVHDEAMRAAHIQSVSMVVYDGMPRLVLDLAYDAAGSTPDEAGLGLADHTGPGGRAHAGVARPRRVDDTMAYETARPSQVPLAAPRASDPAAQAQLQAALALTMPGSASAETPREDRTRLFRTLPPSQMTLEEQMVRSGQWSFRAHRYWEQVLGPALETTVIRLRLFARNSDKLLRPLTVRAARLGLRGSRATLALAFRGALSARDALAAWRVRRADRVRVAALARATSPSSESSAAAAAAPSESIVEAMPAAAEG